MQRHRIGLSHPRIQYLLGAIPRGNLGIMSLAGSLGSLNGIALTFLPIYFTSLGGSIPQYGIVTAMGLLVGTFFTIIGGAVVHRHRPTRILAASSLAAPAALVGYYFSRDWFVLAIIMVLAATASISLPSGRQMVADSTTAKRRATQLSTYQLFGSLPSMFSPIIGGYLVSVFGTVPGFRIAAVIAAGLSFCVTFILFRFLREDKTLLHNAENYPKPLVSTDPAKPAASLVAVFRSVSRAPVAFLKNVASIPAVLVPIMSAFVLVTVANSIVGSYFIFYATDIVKLSSLQWGIIVSAQVILANILRVPLGMLADRLDKRTVLVLSIAMTAPLPALFTLVHSFLGILAISLAMVATGIHYLSTHEALQIDLTPRQKQPVVFSVYDSSGNLAKFVGVIAGGMLFAANYALPFYAFTIIEGLAAAIVFSSLFLSKKWLSLFAPAKN